LSGSSRGEHNRGYYVHNTEKGNEEATTYKWPNDPSIGPTERAIKRIGRALDGITLGPERREVDADVDIL
jgi:hypothetical protein